MIIMPPESQWGQIQEIRKVHDKAYSRWMPHINLYPIFGFKIGCNFFIFRLYPFVPENQYDKFYQKFVDALSSLEPFVVTLKELSYFSFGKSSTMYVKPTNEGIVKGLQSKLQAVVPFCNDLSKLSADGFHPHLTLGQFPTVR